MEISWMKFLNFVYTAWYRPNLQAPIVQTMDSAISGINHYPVDSAIGLIHWILIYPVDSAIHRLNNRGMFALVALSTKVFLA